jgi:deoxyribonuclease V
MDRVRGKGGSTIYRAMVRSEPRKSTPYSRSLAAHSHKNIACCMASPVFYNSVMKKALWSGSIAEAREVQRVLKEKIKISPLKNTPEFIAGADAAFSGDVVFAAASLYKLPSLAHLEDSFSKAKAGLDYMPGLLAFREGNAVIDAIRKLGILTDLILIDGQGIAHPAGIGIASHLGVVLNIPTVGCAKSRLVGEYQEPGTAKGEWSYLFYQGVKVGAVLRTRSNVRPVFVSPGHLVDIESSVEIVMKCVTDYRIPEPLRTADRLSKKLKRDYSEGLN